MTDIELRIFLDQKLCDIADALLKHYNCCDIQGSGCRVKDPNPCCLMKTHLGKPCPFWKGYCDFRNSNCKLWLCETACNASDPNCIKGMLLLEQFGEVFGINRKPLIGDSYIGGADKP